MDHHDPSNRDLVSACSFSCRITPDPIEALFVRTALHCTALYTAEPSVQLAASSRRAPLSLCRPSDEQMIEFVFSFSPFGSQRRKAKVVVCLFRLTAV